MQPNLLKVTETNEYQRQRFLGFSLLYNTADINPINGIKCCSTIVIFLLLIK